MKSNLIIMLCLFIIITITPSFCCSKDCNEDLTDNTPSFLLKGWILPIAFNNARTYDFTQMQAAGKRTVEIRAWQLIGTLGWQSNQQYTASYEATDKRVVMISPTGYKETWEIIEVTSSKMLIELNGQQVYVYNCSEPGWPSLIKQSMRGCR